MKKSIEPVTKIDLDEALEEYDEKNRGYRDQILTRLDKVVMELETIREDNVIGTAQIRGLREDLAGHEKRITTLEQATH
jgi:hypothetical protein